MQSIEDVACPNPNCKATARSEYDSRTGITYTWCNKCKWDSDNTDEENQEIIDNTESSEE